MNRSLALCLVSPSAVMIDRRLFERVGVFDESLPACEDYDLWLRVSCQYPVYLIDRPLVIKRGGHADQLSRPRAGQISNSIVNETHRRRQRFPTASTMPP